MNKTSVYDKSSLTSASNLTKSGLVASLYIAVTLILSVISFGAIQLRLSEMFNYLVLFHKRYVIAVTLGVIIVNFFSPTWALDVPIGGLATFFTLILTRAVIKHVRDMKAKFVVTAVIFTISMFTVAVQLYILLDFPFWWTYFTVAIGELLSMTIGGFIIYAVSKKVDLTK